MDLGAIQLLYCEHNIAANNLSKEAHSRYERYDRFYRTKDLLVNVYRIIFLDIVGLHVHDKL